MQRASLAFVALAFVQCKGADETKASGKVEAKAGQSAAHSPAAHSPAAKPSAKAEESKKPAGPVGSIKGKVTIVGKVPEMPLLKRGSDPKCDNGELRAETILVDPAGGLANVVVRIKPGSVPAWTPPKIISVDQTDCMYRPRVQGGVIGQTVEIKNSDETTHNVHARHLPLGRRQGIETIVNRAQPAGVSMTFALGEEPVAKLKCDYHGWMQGFIVVSDNPYFGVSQPDGSFEVVGVPVGTHSVEAWHEFYGMKEATLTVEEGGVATLDLQYDAVADDPMANKGGSK